VSEENVRNINLDIIERDQISHVEDDILFYIYFHRRFRSENIVDEGKDQSVNDWKTSNIERLVCDLLFVKPCPIGPPVQL
jgi:hypothetical protein